MAAKQVKLRHEHDQDLSRQEQKQEAEYQAWLKSVQTMSSGISKPKKACAKKIEVVASGPVIAAERLQKGHSLSAFGGAGTKPVARPEIMYKDNPEMLERELKARERHRDKCKEK